MYWIFRLEKAPWGIGVSCIMPAGFRTNVYDVLSQDVLNARWASLPAEIKEEYGEDYPERGRLQLIPLISLLN